MKTPFDEEHKFVPISNCVKEERDILFHTWEKLSSQSIMVRNEIQDFELNPI
jgi:hypothetical protein